MDKNNFMELPRKDSVNHSIRKLGSVRIQKSIELDEMKKIYSTLDRDEM